MSTSIRVCLLLLLLPVGVFGQTSLGPDAAGYTATDNTTSSFVNIASTGTKTLAGTDDGTTTADIGFAFLFYGASHKTACISANGYLLFGGCTDAFLNQDLSVSPAPGQQAIVAPLWTDLTFLWPNADAVYHQTLGTAPQRQFVVQWNSAFPQNTGQPVTVQTILYEGSNQIRFQYRQLDSGAGSPASNGGKSTVGICDAGGAATGRCLQWSYNAAVLRSDMAILISPSVQTLTTGDLEEIVSDPDTPLPLKDKLEDALAKFRAAVRKLNQSPPDRQGASGELEGAVGDIEGAVSSGSFEPARAEPLMDHFAGIARLSAQEVIDQKEGGGGNPDKIGEAKQALAQGDSLRAKGQFKEAVAAYKNAVAKGEGA